MEELCLWPVLDLSEGRLRPLSPAPCYTLPRLGTGPT
jgi:hypothetical protein